MPTRRDIIIAGSVVAAGAGLTLALTPKSGRFGLMTGAAGMIAPSAPVQEGLREPIFRHVGRDTLRLFARFEVVAMALSVRRYRDENSDVMPYDVALGWGVASDPSLIRKVDFWQRGRWYYWRASDWGDVPDGLASSSANMHMIPANEAALRALSEIRPGNGVRIRGHLCDLQRPGRPILASSRVRTDVGAGACEIVHAETIERFV